MHTPTEQQNFESGLYMLSLHQRDALARLLRAAILDDLLKCEQYHLDQEQQQRGTDQKRWHRQQAETVRVSIVTAQSAVNQVLGINRLPVKNQTTPAG